MRILLFFFIALPIAEIFVLIKVGGIIGAFNTIALILITAFVGLALLRQQGYSAIARAQSKMSQGALPAQEMVEGIFLAVGGALLLTPGFITDTIGFCCLIPGVRHYLILWGSKHLRGFQLMSSAQMSSSRFESRTDNEGAEDQAKKRSKHVIDGEFERED